MKEILNRIKHNYCKNCDLGAPAVFLGYKSSGTCLDYIYDKFKVPYSFAWEIYTNEREFSEYKDYAKKISTLNINT